MTTANASGFGLAPIASYAADGSAVAGTPITFSTTETTTISGKGTFTDTVVFGTQSVWATGLHLTPACLTDGCSGPSDQLRDRPDERRGRHLRPLPGRPQPGRRTPPPAGVAAHPQPAGR